MQEVDSRCWSCFNIGVDNPKTIFQEGASWQLGTDGRQHWQMSDGETSCGAILL